MPRPPTYAGKPLFGLLFEIRRDRLQLVADVARAGDVMHLHFPWQEAVLISHPEVAKQVLIDDFRSYGKQTRGYNALRVALGQGLVTSEGEHWRKQRRIAQPAFERKRIAQFADAMVAATDEMVARWESVAERGDHVDVDAEMMALTLRIVGECLMSTDLTDDADRVSAALKTLLMAVLDRVSRPVLLPLDIPTPGNLALRRALSALDDMVLRIIQERRTGKTRRDDLLELLVHAVDADTGAAMDDQQLRDEVITMVLAGHETTSNGLTWAFHLLSKFPAVAQRCREEVAVVLGERSPTAADLPHLPYCRATVEESLRLFPPVWMVARSVRHDVQLGGYDIPPGWLVFISPWVMHRDPRFWKNPEGFRPERFLGDEIKGLPKASFIPFVAGPRQCIGAGFARMEAQLILIRILQKFELELVPHRRIELQPMVTLRPRFGMPMFPRRVTLPAAPHAAE